MTKAEQSKVHFKRTLITGFVALFPMVLTIFVFYLCWNAIRRFGEPLVIPFMSWIPGISDRGAEVLGTIATLILALLFVYILGWLLATMLGKRLGRLADRIFGNLPVVSYIYPHAKQLADFLFGKRKLKFDRVVAIEYPRKGMFTIGFATSDGIDAVSREKGRKFIAVFVPSSPAPLTGWTVLVDEDEVMNVEMNVDEAVRFTATCGIITPGSEQAKQLNLPPALPVSESGPETEEPD